MQRSGRTLQLDICDYHNTVLCNLYDNLSDASGQATDVFVTTERNGWKELSFTIPSVCATTEGTEENYRLKYLIADYRLRLTDENGTDWYIISEPKVTHNALSKNVDVRAGHISQLLKNKQLDLEFSDEEGNNVGTAAQLLDAILDGTGWSPGVVETFDEDDGSGEKHRSLVATAGTGAFKMITDMCELFEAKPVFNGDYTVDIRHMNPFAKTPEGSIPAALLDENGLAPFTILDQTKVLEILYGNNAKGITRTLNTENMITSLLAYGSYGDMKGMVSLQTVKHKEFTFTMDAYSSGTEFSFTDDEGESYYFTVDQDITNGTKLIWSKMDPASMSYVWNETTRHAYHVHESKQGEEQAEPITGEVSEVVNQMTRIMDFGYYEKVGLLTEEMFQEVAAYQRDVVPLYETSYTANQNFIQKLGELSDVGESNTGFLRLDVEEYKAVAEGVKITIKYTNQYPDGVMYRTDYMEKRKNFFPWRVATELKPNGDPVRGIGSVVLIVHNTNPVTYEKAYLRIIDNRMVEETDIEGHTVTRYADYDYAESEGVPKTITLWMDDVTSRLNKNTDRVYLFCTNSMMGYLGTQQVADESLVENMTNSLKESTVPHSVYFEDSRIGSIQTSVTPITSNPDGYGWLYRYNPANSNRGVLYFCYTKLNDTGWKRAYCQDTVPSGANGTYFYNTRTKKLYHRESGQWKLMETSAEERIGASFSKVNYLCARRDMIYKGIRQQYTWTNPSSGSALIPGNYAMLSPYDFYWSFTTDQNITHGHSLWVDTTKGCVYQDENPSHVIEMMVKPFDLIDFPVENMLDDVTFTSGTINDLGVEVNSNSSVRSNTIRVYDTTEYEFLLPLNTKIFFYDVNQRFISKVDVIGSTQQVTQTPYQARNMRIVIPGAQRSGDYFRVKDYQKKFFANNTPYTILDPVTHDGIMKGVNNLTKTFADLADSAYMDYLPRSEAATKAISNKTKSMTDLLGDLYRESRWQDDSYVEGDEDKLYRDALKNLEQISRPEATYDVEFLDLYNSNRYEEREWPDITIDYAVHLIDPGIDIDLWAYIDKLNKCYDQPWKTTLELNTNLSMISQHSFTDIMTRIAEVAQEVKNKRGIYGRAEALTGNGTMLAAKLEGTINAYKNKIDGAASNWYTNDKGQIIIESIDGNYAMMLTGAGLMIANSRNEFGDWNWRTAATGDGITADEIVTGTLYARLIEAHGITVDKLHASVGQELEIGSNKALMLFATTDGFRPAGGVNTPANEGDSYIVIAAKDGNNPAHIDVKSGGVVNIEGSELNLSATGNDHSSINVNANSDINISNGGNINIESTGKLIVDSETFSITDQGTVSVKGEIKATSGFIGTDENNGFVITGNSIKNGKRQLNDDTRDGIYIGTDGIAVGNKNDGFLKITSDGTLTISIRKQDIQGLTTTYVQPTAPENPQKGDIWIKADANYGSGKTWNQLSNTKWNNLSGKTWNELLGAKQYVWDGTRWLQIGDYGMQISAETRIQQNSDAISLLATSQIENASQIVQNKAEIQVQSNRITSEVQRLENGIKTNSSAIEQTAQHIYSHVNDNYYGKESGILITADGIDIKSKDVSNVSAVKITPSGISLTAGKQILLSADDLILSGESYNSRISAVVRVVPKIFRQGPQAPQSDASHTLTEGDLWYNTSQNNHLKRYNGTGWDDCDDTGKYAVYSGIVIDANGVYIKTSSSSTDNAISLERSGITLGTNKTLKVAASNLIIGSSDSDTLSAQVTKLSNLDTLVNTTGVPKVKATGMTVDGNTINLTSTGTMHILGNSSIVIGSNASDSAVKIDKDGIYLSTSEKLWIKSGNLQIDENGDVTVTGAITANTGYIGGSNGWTIAPGWLKSGSAGTTVVLNTGGGETDAINNYAMWAGATWPIAYDSQTGNAPFRLTKAGKIYATGVEISGKITAGANSIIGGWTLDAKRIHAGESSTYVALDSGTTSVNYAIWAGAESAASAPFSVTRAGALNATSATIKGTIVARSGKIGADSSDNGGWTIDANQISSGSGTSFVALNSDNSKTNNVYNHPYAIWVGNGKAANAPFRVGRDGTVYLTKLAVKAEGSSTYDFIDLSGNSSNVKYPLWKLNYYTVKSYSENSITLSNNATVNFNTAASALIYTSWDGGGSISSTPNLQIETRTTPTGTPINQRNISFSADSGTGNESPSSGKTITVNSFDANAKAKAWMNASIDSSTSRLFTVNIDASNLLSSVALSGSWSGNSSSGWTFTTTNTANSRTTTTTIGRQFSPSSGWNASWKKQITITGTGQGLLYQWTEDASDAYETGVTDGEAKFTEYTGQKYRVSNGNFRDYTLYYRTKNPDESYSFNIAGTGKGFVQVAEIADTLYTKSEE